MSRTGLDLWLFLAGVAVFTVTAAILDWRYRRIPNALSIGGFLAGLLFRVFSEGLPGFGDALLGFGIGFGCLLVLYMIGGGGGGDVKLMGALSVWLGAKQTTLVFIASAVLAFGFAAIHGAMTRPLFPAFNEEKSARPRVTIAFAVPLAVATWALIGFQLLAPRT